MTFSKFLSLGLLACSMTAYADDTTVTSVKVLGPVGNTHNIFMTTDKDSDGKEYDMSELEWNCPMDMSLWQTSPQSKSMSVAPDDSIGYVLQGKGMWQIGFSIENHRWQKVNVLVSTKRGRSQVVIDGKEVNGEQGLITGRHDVVIKLQEKTDEGDSVCIKLSAGRDSLWTSHLSGITINPATKRHFTLQDQMTGTRLNRVSISAAGRFVIQWRYTTRKDGGVEWKKEITDLKTMAHYPAEGFVQWAAKGDKYIASRRNTDGKTEYFYRDVITGEKTPITTLRVDGSAYFVAQDTKLLLNMSVEGPKEKNAQVHQIVHPDDRIPGWRNKNNYALLDIATGEVRRLTWGFRSVGVTMSRDGSKAVFSTRYDDATRRPYNFGDAFLIDFESGKVDTLFVKEGFVAGMQFSPDGKQLLITGSPEAFDGIGNVCGEGVIPNTFDYQLFVMDLDTKRITPLTRDFDPSVGSCTWSKLDGNIYAICEVKDGKGIYSLSGKALAAGKIEWTKLDLNETYVSHWDLAEDKPLLVYSGEGSMTSDRTWLLDLKSGKHTLLADINPERTADVEMGQCQDWNFTNSRGEEITGCYYLPPYFDETKQYPMLVYYYGGVSPTARVLDSPYCYQAWASMGYVVYVIQPAGCVGFGQKFSAMHSNAWGDYTADDIIEGTKQFCKEHPYVNAQKIGCLGASYGGFMTQYLQTKTDIFAAAMSHAGISNITSYWGEGYWGYSYNACAAPNSHPWNNPRLFTEHSPLFNADKINTPILFMHGGADTNVPVGESIQMFNALKILGKETAFVMVDGQDHYIGDHHKRIAWHNSIMAWFQRWLQDDASWWNELYPEKNF